MLHCLAKYLSQVWRVQLSSDETRAKRLYSRPNYGVYPLNQQTTRLLLGLISHRLERF
jgi:hypothetical protein